MYAHAQFADRGLLLSYAEFGKKVIHLFFFSHISRSFRTNFMKLSSVLSNCLLLYFIFSSSFIYTGQLLAHLLRALLHRPRLLQVAYRTHCICILNCWVNKVQGRGDGPKASMSRASEAARVKAELDCATLWVCFAYMLKP